MSRIHTDVCASHLVSFFCIVDAVQNNKAGPGMFACIKAIGGKGGREEKEKKKLTEALSKLQTVQKKQLL